MAERRQSDWERRLIAALGDVPVPAGLLRRVSDHLGLAVIDTPSRGNPSLDAAVPGVSPAGGIRLPDRSHWRRLIWSASSLVAIALLLAGFALFTNNVSPHSELRDQAIGWTLTLPEQWQPLDAIELDPPVPALLRTSPVACQKISTRYDPNTMVYLLDQNSRHALLFAFRQTPLLQLGGSVRHLAGSSGIGGTGGTAGTGGTGGWEIAAWEDGNFVYVLSVNTRKGHTLDRHLHPAGVAVHSWLGHPAPAPLVLSSLGQLPEAPATT
jgi:hypothetical protein